jgi:hypothetical protein
MRIGPHVGGKDPISKKKLKKGNAMFLIEKEILGFMLQGMRWTAWLPVPKSDAIVQELKCLLKKKHCPLKCFLSISGKVMSATWIAPSAKAFLTPFFKMAKNSPKLVGIRQHSDLRQAIKDLTILIIDLTKHPTHVNKIVPHPPSITGCCYTSLNGTDRDFSLTSLSQLFGVLNGLKK